MTYSSMSAMSVCVYAAEQRTLHYHERMILVAVAMMPMRFQEWRAEQLPLRFHEYFLGWALRFLRPGMHSLLRGSRLDGQAVRGLCRGQLDYIGPG
eukprot:CAMPEP_0119405012 /NCGR_PEP_ID=MMETSP1334-20130426/144182_1 /TAXON_ID=127549 /ORGANISM="Calcidiscus leptoporus, Strain RCC1130" /LENGTH=95 /DNA_ID=CAMNT_0007428983 /DNA_START=799 /DNA_END=1085 /DNA_ORIENTATION=+